jgi:WD40 repeat protein
MIHHLRSIEFESEATALSVSADGSLVAVATGRAIDLITVETGECVLRVATKEAATGLSLSSDRRLLAAATGEPTVVIYDCISGATTQELRRDTVIDFLRDQSQPQVAFFPGTKILATRGVGSDVTIWNCESGQWEHLVRIPQRNGFIVMSPDGTHVAVLGEPNRNEYRGQVVMFRVHQGLQLVWNRGHDDQRGVSSGAFSPGGTRLATYVPGNEIRVWGVQAGELLAHVRLEQSETISGIAFGDDEHHLLVIKSRTIELCHIGTANVIAKETSRQPSNFQGFATSREGAVLVTFGTNKSIDIWKVPLTPQKSSEQ